METTAQHGAALVECIAPLADENRRAVRAYWEQVIREEWMPPVRRIPQVVAQDGRRQRREARRAMARIAAAGRLASVVVLPTSAPSGSTRAADSGEAA